jgi:WD40 repeat protein
MNEEEPPRKAKPTRKPDLPAPQVQAPVTVGAVAPGGKVVGVEIGRVENLILEPAAAPEPGDPPYKGLDFYDVADAPLFFGRERLTADMVEAVREHTFLAIVGASGSGKSSLARAGLIAALLGRAGRSLERGVQPPLGSRDWRYVAVTPTAAPFEALARGLAGDGTAGAALLTALAADPLALRTHAASGEHLLLLVDQFEELFTLCKDKDQRANYINALLAACGEPAFDRGTAPCTVILTVRADFYDRCIGFEKLRAALERHQKPIGAMTRGELRRTIERPAETGRWAFEDGLVELILAHVGEQPGRLPLLSYALLETWRRRSGRVMTLAGYQAAGGVDRAISRTSERVFAGLAEQGLADVARRILLSLVDPGQEERATRRREQLRALAPAADESPVRKALLALSDRDARLVTVDGESVQISHEALITAWPKLGEWLTTYRDDLRLLDGIRDAAAAWAAAPEAEQENLLIHRGGRLEDALRLRDGGEYTLADPAPAYLDACVALREREREAERQRQRDRFRLIAGAAVVALILAALAVWQARIAQTQAKVRRASEISADAQASAAKAPELSLLLAAEAFVRGRNLEPEHRIVKAKQALLDGLTTTGGLLLTKHTRQIGELGLSTDGKWLASGSAWDGTAWLWNLDAARRQWRGNGADMNAIPTSLSDQPINATLMFSHDNHWLAVYGSGNDSIVKLWDLRTEEPALLHANPEGATNALAFHPDNCHLATGDTSGMLRVWNLCQASLTDNVLAWAGHLVTVTAVAYSPDGRWLATVDDGQALKLWDMRSQQSTHSPIVLDNRVPMIGKIEFDPNSAWLLASNWQGAAALWHIDGLSKGQQGAKFSPVLTTETGGHPALSGDGRWFAALRPVQGKQGSPTRFDVTLYRLTPDNGQLEIQTQCSFSGNPVDLVISQDGRWVVIPQQDGRIDLLDTTSAADCDSRSLRAPGTVGTSVLISADSRRLTAWTDYQRIAYLWELPLKSERSDPLELNAHEGGITAAMFSADSRFLVTGDSGGGMRLWDLASATATTAIPFTFGKGYDPFGNCRKSITTPDAKWVASTYLQGDTAGIAFWETSPHAGKAPRMLCPTSSGDYVLDFGFNMDTSLLMIKDGTGHLDLFDIHLTEGRCTRRSFPAPNEPLSSGVIDTFIGPNGHWLIVQDDQGRFSLQDPAIGQTGDNTPCISDPPAAGHSADGGFYLALDSYLENGQAAKTWHRLTWGRDQSGGLWCRAQLLSGVKQVFSSVNGEWAAAVMDRDGVLQVEIWKLEGQKSRVIRTMRLDHASDPMLAIDNSGRWLAEPAGSAIRLWRLADGSSAPISHTLSLRKTLASFTFSQDSRWLAASNEDSSIQLWDLTGDGPSQPLVFWMDPKSRGTYNNPHYDWVAAGVNFSADSQSLIGVSSYDVKIWPLNMSTLLDLSCRTAGRNLTPDEQEQFLPDAAGHLICPNLPKGE